MSRLFKANQYYNQLTQNKTELSPGTISACVTKIFNRSRKLDTHRRSEKKPFFGLTMASTILYQEISVTCEFEITLMHMYYVSTCPEQKI